jgi:hypothetical protein
MLGLTPSTKAARAAASERWPDPAVPAGTLRLKLAHRPAEGEKLVTRDLSAVAVQGETLFLSGDESAHVEALDRLSGKLWSEHRRIDLSRVFDLPDAADEMDMEGLAVSDDWLWIVGSHSRTRCKPPKNKPVDAAALARMAELKDNANRFFLGDSRWPRSKRGAPAGAWPASTRRRMGGDPPCSRSRSAATPWRNACARTPTSRPSSRFRRRRTASTSKASRWTATAWWSGSAVR